MALRRVSKADRERNGERIAKIDLIYEIKDNSRSTFSDSTIQIYSTVLVERIDVEVKIMSSEKRDPNNVHCYYENIRIHTLELFNHGGNAIFVTCPEFLIKNASICERDHFRSRDIELPIETFQFSITIEVQPKPTKDNMTIMYEDTEITDFELCAEDGSVKVHKVVLATASPVFKAMLTNDWKEKNEGRVEIPDISKETLESLKKYMYVHTIDKNVSIENLLQLLQLATYYMMPDMEQDCSRLIEEKITDENIWFILSTAFQNKYQKLLLIILQNINNQRICAIENEFCKPEQDAATE